MDLVLNDNQDCDPNFFYEGDSISQTADHCEEEIKQLNDEPLDEIRILKEADKMIKKQYVATKL